MWSLEISSTKNYDLHLKEFEANGHKAWPIEDPLYYNSYYNYVSGSIVGLFCVR